MKSSVIAVLVPFAACMGCGPADDGSVHETSPAGEQAMAGQAGSSPSSRIDWPTPPAPAAPASDTEDAAQRDAIVRELLEDPAAHKPETYVFVTQHLWSRGDRLQAAFWHYLFQIRTAPWLQYEPEMAPFRGAVNESLGGAINRWIGSDYDAWEAVTRRAVAYERRLPLSPERPAGLDESEWLAHVAQARAAWTEDFESVFGAGGSGRAEMEAQRRANGLPVGPLEAPGAPLPDHWR